jgi:hypothetical protein
MSDETVAMLAPGLGVPNLTSLDLYGAFSASLFIIDIRSHAAKHNHELLAI